MEFVGRARISATGSLMAVLLFGLAALMIYVGLHGGQVQVVVAGPVLVVIDALFVYLCKVDTYLSDSAVTVKMPPFPSRTHAFDDIDSAVATPEGSGFRGLGYRWLGPQTVAYLSGGGEVRLGLHDGSTFTFSCPAARDVVERIETAQGL